MRKNTFYEMKGLQEQHIKTPGRNERQERYERRVTSRQIERMKYLLRKYGDRYYSHTKQS